MPYVGDVYQLPPGSTATPNTTIESAKYNTVLNDLATAQNTARPVLGGGTGGQTAVAGNDGLNTKGADIASAGTTNLANATGIYVNITGTTTINSFGTVAAGAIRQLTFTGILTITYNATSMILPGAANITTAAGDTATFRSLGGGNWRCVDYLRASGQSVTNVIVSPNITGATTITDTGTNLLTLTSTDAGSGAGPNLIGLRNSASPAANDLLTQIALQGKNSAAGTIPYSALGAQILDPTVASEDGLFYITSYVAGVNGFRLYVGAGVYTPTATGGDKGAGTINATAFYQNGVALPFTKSFESAQQAISSNGSFVVAHGLGTTPTLYRGYIKCVAAELGYSIGDELPMDSASTDATAGQTGVAIIPDATNITVRYSANMFVMPNKSTGGMPRGAYANWKYIVRAWA